MKQQKPKLRKLVTLQEICQQLGSKVSDIFCVCVCVSFIERERTVIQCLENKASLSHTFMYSEACACLQVVFMFFNRAALIISLEEFYGKYKCENVSV